MTNNTKALIGVFINGSLLALLAFGIDLTGEQVGAVMIPVNGLLALIQIATYKQSSKRVPDSPNSTDHPVV